MKRCPRCGNYMSSYLESIFGSARTVWSCPCGYFEKIEPTTADIVTRNMDLSRVTNRTEVTRNND